MGYATTIILQNEALPFILHRAAVSFNRDNADSRIMPHIQVRYGRRGCNEVVLHDKRLSSRGIIMVVFPIGIEPRKEKQREQRQYSLMHDKFGRA
jgi:hypothetical protein